MGSSLLMINRDYRLLFSASALSNLGDGISIIAMPWLATLLTHDPLLISVVAMAQRLPWLLFSLPVGVLTDRVNRRTLMVRADLARVALMVCTIGMILSVADLHQPGTTDSTAILSLAVIAFLFGSAEVVRDNAAQTILPSLVAPDDLEHANAQMWSAEQITGQFIGPPFAGLMIASSIVVPFGFEAGFYAIAAGLIWLIALPPRKPTVSFGFWPALIEGFRWIKGSATILRLAVILGIMNAMFVGGMTIFVLFAQEVLHLSATGYGLLLTCGAMGGVVGGLISPRIIQRIGARPSLLLSLCIGVLFNLTLALSGSVVFAGVALFLQAASAMLWNVVTVSYRQRMIPDHLLGRVNSVYRFFGWGAMPFGALAAGALVTSIESEVGLRAALHFPYMIAAVIYVTLTVYSVKHLHFQ